MGTLVITPENEQQAEEIKALVKSMKLSIQEISDDDKEDLGLLKAMLKGEKEKRTVKVSTFLKNLRT